MGVQIESDIILKFHKGFVIPEINVFFNCCVESVSVNSKDNTSTVNYFIFFHVILLLRQKK